jgi:hypothetical protein
MNVKEPKIPFQGYAYTSSDKTIVRRDWTALLPDMIAFRGVKNKKYIHIFKEWLDRY